MSRSTLRGERSSSYATAPTKNSVRSLSPAAPRSKALPSARPAHRAHPLIEDDDSGEFSLASFS
ncbi:hypothetical protein AMTR_s00076p00186680 [Amborella trichopoda]|uniref:Uncharacterized protein n=1 Tax=Amborella trichopoda TaxID=13333 RepID=W1PAM0_AMBTC|nr:hypothetical protein AMTR_s00076p00186680 [Amborella trichopoda]